MVQRSAPAHGAVVAIVNRHRTQIYLLGIVTISSFITWNMLRVSLQSFWDRTETTLLMGSGQTPEPDPWPISTPDRQQRSTHAGLELAAGSGVPDRDAEAPSPSATEPVTTPLDHRLEAILRWRYFDQCRTPLPLAPGELVAQIGALDEFYAVQVGHEMWNRLSLGEVDDPLRYYGNDSDPGPFPFTVLSYGQRLDQGQALLRRIGADRTDLVSYPSLQVAFDNRPYLSRQLFRNAVDMSRDRFASVFSGKDLGYLLSTLNQWVVLERMRNGTYPDEVLVVEDDVFMVPDFQRKFRVLRSQLGTLPWEVVFVGTCHQIKSDTAASANLFVAGASRCFNTVMLRRSAAVKVLEAGALRDDFVAVDHLFNMYIPALNLTAYYVYPPLAYEQSKISIAYPC